MASDKLKLPQFALIKQYLRGQIDAGIWVVGTRTPSENELASTFSVSRMTARRALQELADEGLLLRKPGMGSFVARPKPVSPQLEITDPLQQAQATRILHCAYSVILPADVRRTRLAKEAV